MGEWDSLVGPRLLIQALKDNLAMKPEAACNLVCLETGSAKIHSYRPVRGDGNCGYRAVMAGLVESAQSSAQLKGHLLQKLAELMGIISTLEVIGSLGTSYAMHLQCGYDHLMKAVANPHKLPMEELLEPSRQQKASDQMLLFIRAICAVGLLLEPTDSLVNLQTMLEEARVCCSAWDLEKCLTACVLPLGSDNIVTWFDDYSIKGLAAALCIGIRLYSVGQEDPLQFTYPEESEASFKLIKHGVHYDLVY